MRNKKIRLYFQLKHRDVSFTKRNLLNHLLKEFNTESTTKFSNFNSQWTKTLYQNNLKNSAFFLIFLRPKEYPAFLLCELLCEK